MRVCIRITEITLQHFSHGTPHRPHSLRDIENSFRLSFVHTCVCVSASPRTLCVCVYVRTITPITSHTSVCGGDEDEKKPAEMRAGGKKDPDCESPVGAKDVYVARSRFALSDRSRGLLCSHCTSTLHLSLSPRLFARMMGGKVASAGWTEYIYSR